LSDYDGFNLIIFDGITLLYVNNQGDPVQVIEPGVYALSNHRLDSPWPKVDYAREQLERDVICRHYKSSHLTHIAKYTQL
jgi:uncharacterized protein with NRDE domain